jgi:hypothetical protein
MSSRLAVFPQLTDSCRSGLVPAHVSPVGSEVGETIISLFGQYEGLKRIVALTIRSAAGLTLACFIADGVFVCNGRPVLFYLPRALVKRGSGQGISIFAWVSQFPLRAWGLRIPIEK